LPVENFSWCEGKNEERNEEGKNEERKNDEDKDRKPE
jgi:hypothetical protein